VVAPGVLGPVPVCGHGDRKLVRAPLDTMCPGHDSPHHGLSEVRLSRHCCVADSGGRVPSACPTGCSQCPHLIGSINHRTAKRAAEFSTSAQSAAAIFATSSQSATSVPTPLSTPVLSTPANLPSLSSRHRLSERVLRSALLHILSHWNDL
jgi:hypothetical protein